ncbi:hypothetical protein DASC09_043640 [Saccharomycopsis crataegensis]|uniref:Uncharacterized protein n=1 Tax=Saccharomycopsis crataegensis TaxID=43959 RepID=A0AAV5QQP9_9ASCO|nr:hypothetical protein DASC09_043640 [Saccharomycopsis crataegensis]
MVLKPYPANNFTSSRYLYLSLSATWKINHLKLETLNLSSNALRTLDNIHSTPHLLVPEIQDNLLEDIDRPLFFPKLKNLNISSNPIRVLDENIASLSSLGLLEAKYCEIELISIDLSRFKNLQRNCLIELE